MANRETRIKLLMQEFKHLFEANFKNYSPKRMGDTLYLPYSGLDYEEGIPLKNDVGYITIEETIKRKSNEPIGYIYRFFTKNYECITYKKDSQENNVDCFSFHYDKEVDDIKHPPHLTVMYPDIRYLSKQITLKDFLLFLDQTFFTKKPTGIAGKGGYLWSNRL